MPRASSRMNKETLEAEYFDKLYRADTPGGKLPFTGLGTVNADPPIDETPASLGTRMRIVRIEVHTVILHFQAWQVSWRPA